MECEIRFELAQDIASIRRIHEAAFGRRTEAVLVDLLRTRNKLVVFLIALRDAHPIGHVAFSDVAIAAAPAGFRAIGLAPVAVLPEYQKLGVGSLLIREGLRRCREDGYGGVIVLGHPAYYPRFGFSQASDFGLENEYGANEAFMALELKDGAFRDVSGLVKYQPEFSEAGC